jgi:hypothetical protein
MRKAEKFLVTFWELWDDDCTFSCNADFDWDAEGVCDALRDAGAFPFPCKHDASEYRLYYRVTGESGEIGEISGYLMLTL